MSLCYQREHYNITFTDLLPVWQFVLFLFSEDLFSVWIPFGLFYVCVLQAFQVLSLILLSLHASVSFFDIGCFDNCCAFDSFNPFGLFSLWPHAFSFCFFLAPPPHQTISSALPFTLSDFFSTIWNNTQRITNTAMPFVKINSYVPMYNGSFFILVCLKVIVLQ